MLSLGVRLSCFFSADFGFSTILGFSGICGKGLFLVGSMSGLLLSGLNSPVSLISVEFCGGGLFKPGTGMLRVLPWIELEADFGYFD